LCNRSSIFDISLASFRGCAGSKAVCGDRALRAAERGPRDRDELRSVRFGRHAPDTPRWFPCDGFPGLSSWGLWLTTSRHRHRGSTDTSCGRKPSDATILHKINYECRSWHGAPSISSMSGLRQPFDHFWRSIRWPHPQRDGAFDGVCDQDTAWTHAAPATLRGAGQARRG
jgi:hypothetical protein